MEKQNISPTCMKTRSVDASKNAHTKICSLIIGSYVSSRKTVDWRAPTMHLKPQRDDLVSTAPESFFHKCWVLCTHQSKHAWACGVGVTWHTFFFPSIIFLHSQASSLECDCHRFRRHTHFILAVWNVKWLQVHDTDGKNTRLAGSLNKWKVDRVLVLLLQ